MPSNSNQRQHFHSGSALRILAVGDCNTCGITVPPVGNTILDKFCRELEEGGIPVFAVMPRTLDDVSTLLRQYGVLLDAQVVAGRTMADLTAARLHAGEFRRSLVRPLRAATLIWKKPWMVAGAGRAHPETGCTW